MIDLKFSSNSFSSFGAPAKAWKMSRTLDAAVRPSGRFRENRRDTKSARSVDMSKSALYIRCMWRLPRRTSTMIAIAGFSAAM